MSLGRQCKISIDHSISTHSRQCYDDQNYGSAPKNAARSYGDRAFTAMMMAKVYCVQMVSFGMAFWVDDYTNKLLNTSRLIRSRSSATTSCFKTSTWFGTETRWNTSMMRMYVVMGNGFESSAGGQLSLIRACFQIDEVTKPRL